MPAPDNILRLVERFERNREDYRRGRYNETQLRREFLDPFFIELGWDVYNAEGCAEAYKDVIHEDAIRIGPSVNAPDYCFRIGGTRKFFVEAKKPSTDIRDDPHPAYQLRRYAWSAKLPLSILSDFEEFAVYDCRVRPKPTDKASAARILYITFDEYPHRWDEIAGVFSKQAVRQGSFDQFAESKKKRGTAEVDDAFLAEIETWRDALARNIALRNPGLSNRQLNFAVQRTIDRIIFLRIAEDRGLERHGELLALTSGPDVYARLLALFRRADDRYNSGLFHFEREKDRHTPPDELTPVLTIDDKPLKDIFKSLYYPQSPYEFSVLPVEILGQVYERFLGKVITLTPGHRAKIEDKPEVKKAGGVYYTPAYIVDYIVEHTVGELLKTRHVESFKTRPPRMNEPLTVLDPACGSGSFLLGAYQRLLDWHLKYYSENDPDTWLAAKYPPIVETTSPAAPEVPEGRVGRAHAVEAGGMAEGTPGRAHAVHDAGAGDPLAHADGNDASGPAAPPRSFKLTVAERKRILLDHIYGVDIDPQAVEVTKLSLLLKVLEGEKQLLLFATERALPDLADNIKCGNSLIGPDFYQGRQPLLFDEDQRLKINAFDWNAEFADIMTRGGFDAVIGNPPYVRQESLSEYKDYFSSHYSSFYGVADLYTYFIERGLMLLNPAGLFSIIVSSSFLKATYGRGLRTYLAQNAAILELVDFGGVPVFENAKDTYVCIPRFARCKQPDSVRVCKLRALPAQDLQPEVEQSVYEIPQVQLTVDGWTLDQPEVLAIFHKMCQVGRPLGEYINGRFYRGITTGLNEAFVINSQVRAELVATDPSSASVIKPFLRGQDLRRWYSTHTDLWLIFTRRGTDIDRLPAIKDYLSKFRKQLEPRQPGSRGVGRKPGRYQWYEIQDDTCYYPVFDGPKIVYPDITKEPRFSIDLSGAYLANTGYCVGSADPYLLGLLNSRLCWFAISMISIPFGIRAGQYRYRLIHQYMEKVPIGPLDPSLSTEKSYHDRVVELVEAMLALHKALDGARTPAERTAIERQITATDQAIDQLVYELYGLTDEEIRIVEEAR